MIVPFHHDWPDWSPPVLTDATSPCPDTAIYELNGSDFARNTRASIYPNRQGETRCSAQQAYLKLQQGPGPHLHGEMSVGFRPAFGSSYSGWVGGFDIRADYRHALPSMFKSLAKRHSYI